MRSTDFLPKKMFQWVLLIDRILSAPVSNDRLFIYSDAFSRLPGNRKTKSDIEWMPWFVAANLLIETIELCSISRGLIAPGDGLRCDYAYEPDLWNALFCHQIIRRLRRDRRECVGYGLPDELIDALLSKNTVLR